MSFYLIRINHRGCEDSFVIERKNQFEAIDAALKKMASQEICLISIHINEISRECAVSCPYSELYASVRKEDETVSEQESESYQLTEEQRKLIVMLLEKYTRNIDTSDIRDAIGDDEVNRLTKNARLAKLALRKEE